MYTEGFVEMMSYLMQTVTSSSLLLWVQLFFTDLRTVIHDYVDIFKFGTCLDFYFKMHGSKFHHELTLVMIILTTINIHKGDVHNDKIVFNIKLKLKNNYSLLFCKLLSKSTRFMNEVWSISVRSIIIRYCFHWFCYYLCMVSQRINTDDCHWKAQLVDHRSQVKRCIHHGGATWGNIRTGQEAEREWGKIWARVSPMASTVSNGWGKVSSFRLASLNNFNGLWGTGAVPSCLVSASAR